MSIFIAEPDQTLSPQSTQNSQRFLVFRCSSVSRSLLLLFLCQRRVQIEHSVGQLHLNLLMLEVYAFQIRLGVRNLAALASLVDNQQGRFARAKLNVFN